MELDVMNRFKCTLAYDGAGFEGYQIQKEKRTVQLEVQKALSRIHKGQEVKISASGRTDARVHAVGQVFHFDSPLNIAEESWQKALNVNLPKDVWVKKWREWRIAFTHASMWSKRSIVIILIWRRILTCFAEIKSITIPIPLIIKLSKKPVPSFRWSWFY